MRLHPTPLLTLSLLTTALIACGGDAPAPSEVRTALREDLARVLREAEAASAAADSLPTGAAFGFATNSFGGSEGIALRTLRPMTRMIAPRADRAILAFDEEEGGSAADAIVQTLETELFTDANHLGGGVYKVPASLVCETTTWDETTGEEITSIDPECAQRLDQAELRVRVEEDDDALRFHIQIDKNHDEPLSFLLAHDELAITINLDDAGDAITELAALFGEQAPNVQISGQITGSLKILGAAHARAALKFDRAISLKFADTGIGLDSDDAFRFSSAAGEIVAVELDGNTPSASFALGLGETRVHTPGDSLDPQSTDVFLGGATMNAELQGQTLTVSDVSLGSEPTTVHVGGQLGLQVDLNNGGSFDATITGDEVAGTETLTISSLDLRTTIDHAVLGDEAPVYDVTRVQIAGSLRGHSDGLVEILSGSASIETNPSGYGFSATAGQCVTATEVYDDTTYTSYTTYAVGACP